MTLIRRNGWELRRSGDLAFWLFDTRAWRLGNAIQTVRYWLWRAAGGTHD